MPNQSSASQTDQNSKAKLSPEAIESLMAQFSSHRPSPAIFKRSGHLLVIFLLALFFLLIVALRSSAMATTIMLPLVGLCVVAVIVGTIQFWRSWLKLKNREQFYSHMPTLNQLKHPGTNTEDIFKKNAES